MKLNLNDKNLIEQIKNASYEELDKLSSEIRDFLVQKVSKTGGHLASNLGIVELTLALHRVFDSPHDKFVFDVGHQSYIHKIITGRGEQFDSLRQFGGLSGFPKSRESIHDIYDTGHSSTSLSAALGIATARDLEGEDYDVVAVIGDGSMTGGIVYEALNNIGASKKNITIILNDNGMSISHNVGAMSKYLNRIRTSPAYKSSKTSIRNALFNIPIIGKAIYGGISAGKNRIKYSLIHDEGHLIENFGIKYIGPVDGYNIKEMVDIISSTRDIEGPKLIHIITTKGKGYKFAEENPSRFHGIGPFDIKTGKGLSNSSKFPTYSEVFGEALTDIAKDNDKIIAITAAMADATGLKPFYEKYPDRFFDVGIAEEHAVVFAAGLAKSGFTPVVAIYSSFLQRAIDCIIEDVCLQDLHVLFAIDRAGLVGADGETHHGQFDLSYLSMIPNIQIFTPADMNQLREILEYAVNLSGPVAIRYPRGSAKFSHLRIKKFKGENIVLSTGNDVTILAVGSMLDQATQILEKLKSLEFSAGMVNVCKIKPLDFSQFDIDSKLIVTLEDNVYQGGFGQNLSAALNDRKVLSFALPDEFISHGSVDELRAAWHLDTDSIVESIRSELEK